MRVCDRVSVRACVCDGDWPILTVTRRFQNQWAHHDGKCGLCGDPYQGPLEHEAGGQFATGTIAAEYTSGSAIDVTVQITANHKGWFEFRLCDTVGQDRSVS